MKIAKGGTDMWCGLCEKVRTCKSIPGADVTSDATDYSQRRHFRDHNDVNWFQRGRRCLTCGHEFLTGEADLHFLEELVELREALSAIKKNAEQYAKESEKATESLNQLNASLGKLRALRIYTRA